MSNPRSLAVKGQEVTLQIRFFDASGDPINADRTPSISIRNIDGEEILAERTRGVSNTDVGLYEYIYRVPDDADEGAWMDDWSAIIDETIFNTTLFFSVVDPDSSLSANSGPGRIRIADDVIFDFSDAEIYGINILLKYLKARLRSTGLRPVKDEFGAFVRDAYGEFITEECNVFDDDTLVCFLCQALSEFNMIPFFTTYGFYDQIIQTLFSSAIVEGAYIFALASQALVEKGRDFTISDGGVNYQPPQLGDFIQSHYGTWLTSYRERLKFIKNSIRPGPRGYGTYSNMGSAAPAFTRLRHLRARRII
jgi:hypothetical protein